MRIRRLICLLVIALAATTLWAQGKITLEGLLAKSDALYYYPSERGVTDLAVDLVIEQLGNDQLGKEAKDARVTYYYAGEQRETMILASLPEISPKVQAIMEPAVTPMGQYIMPRTSSSFFAGMSMSMRKVTRQIAGVPGTTFYQITGTLPATSLGAKEQRVLLSEDGLLRQLEEVLTAPKQAIMATIENIQTKDGWHIATVTRQWPTDKMTVWRIEHVDYETVDGFVLPVRITFTYRDGFNRPVAGPRDVTVRLEKYRVNTGEAAAFFTELEKKATPAPAPAPQQE